MAGIKASSVSAFRLFVTGTLPTMRLDPAVTNLFEFRYENFTLEGYDPHPAIRAPIAV